MSLNAKLGAYLPTAARFESVLWIAHLEAKGLAGQQRGGSLLSAVTSRYLITPTTGVYDQLCEMTRISQICFYSAKVEVV